MFLNSLVHDAFRGLADVLIKRVVASSDSPLFVVRPHFPAGKSPQVLGVANFSHRMNDGIIAPPTCLALPKN